MDIEVENRRIGVEGGESSETGRRNEPLEILQARTDLGVHYVLGVNPCPRDKVYRNGVLIW